MNLLPAQLPWFVAGPGIGLLLVVMYAIGNNHLGISSSYLRTAQAVVWRRVPQDAWKVRYFIGLAAGALLASLLSSAPAPSYDSLYGALGGILPAAALVLAVPLFLFIGGVLMGYGARWAGGCTSGHGISGSAALSPASIVSTITFMGVAIALMFVINLLTGGAL
jgi:uncharacterized membrane protein YedE/YeeE